MTIGNIVSLYRGSSAAWVIAAFMSFALSVNAHAQSQDATAEAKQHYQNAMAAIAKSDWFTAKIELLQAEKLAPQNALIHYDLAVALSHVGEKSSAQSQATTALNLGLVGAEKETAQRLASGSELDRVSTRAHRVRASPDLAIAWLIDHKSDFDVGGGGDFYILKANENCGMVISSTAGGRNNMQRYSIDFSKLDPDSVRADKLASYGYGPAYIGTVSVKPSVASDPIKYAAEGPDGMKDHTSEEATFRVSTPAFAQKVARAFRDIIVQCGGKHYGPPPPPKDLY